MVGADGVDGFLALDEALEVVGFGMDGGDFAVQGADPVGAVEGLDGEDGVGLGLGLGLGRELSGIRVLRRGRVVIVVGVGDGCC